MRFRITPQSKNPVLLVMHRLESEPGAIGQYLRSKGLTLDIRRPRFGDPLPDSLRGYAGAIVFGGPMSANDPDDYIKTEIDWLAVPLHEQKPLLGICLGAQMLAKQLGGEVYKHAAGHVEAGYEPLSPKPAAEALGPWPSHVYQWHQEGFTLPEGAALLAEGSMFTNQAFRYGASAYGLQFHPEITLAMIHRWTVRAAARLSSPGAQKPHEHVSGHAVHGAALREWTHRFLDHWLRSDREDERSDAPLPLRQAA